jgi:hypothetical protein
MWKTLLSGSRSAVAPDGHMVNDTGWRRKLARLRHWPLSGAFLISPAPPVVLIRCGVSDATAESFGSAVRSFGIVNARDQVLDGPFTLERRRAMSRDSNRRST